MLNRGPPRLSRHRLRRTNRTTWNLLFGTIADRHMEMDAIWIKGHTNRTGPVNKQHNVTDELAGAETENTLPEGYTLNKFPLYVEDFLIFDHNNQLIECDVELAAIQRSAQVHFNTFCNTHSNIEESTLITFTKALSAKLGGVHHVDKLVQPTLANPALHRLLIHTWSNTLPCNTRHTHPIPRPLDMPHPQTRNG